MKLDYFRPRDIAKRMGLSEEIVRVYLDEFDEFLTYATEKGEKFYTPDVLFILERIVKLSPEFGSVEEVMDALDAEMPQLRRQKDLEVKDTCCGEG